MLRIYEVCLEVEMAVVEMLPAIGRRNAVLAKQLDRSVQGIGTNVAEGSAHRAGNRRLRYETALGEARETLHSLRRAGIRGYVVLDDAVIAKLNRIIGTLVRVLYPTCRAPSRVSQ